MVENKEELCDFIFSHLLQILRLGAFAGGIAYGLVIKTFTPDKDKNLLQIPGKILIMLLQLLTCPLIVSGMATGVASLRADVSRKLAINAIVYFVLTTILSVTTGLILVLVLKPGFDIKISRTDYKEISYPLVLMNLGRNMVPQNLIEACFRTYKYVLVESHMSGSNSTLNMSTPPEIIDMSYEEVSILGLLMCAFVFGLVLRKLGEEIAIIADFTVILYGLTSSVVVWIDWYLPLGILFMMASYVAEVDNWNTLYKLGKFIGVIGIGLIFHAAINLPIFYFLIVRHNPIAVINGVCPALLRALITSSSSSTMPLTFQCCEANLMIDRRVTRFMLPIGVYLSRSANALYQVAAVVFIIQLNGDDVDLDKVIILVLTATLSSIGSGVIQASGMITTFFILTAVSLPARDAVILVAAEWVINHCNTAVDVLAGCFGAAYVYHRSKN